MAKAVAVLVALVGCWWGASARAVVLVNPDGSPVGGMWQRWADEMRVPTVAAAAFTIDPTAELGTASIDFTTRPLTIYIAPPDPADPPWPSYPNQRWALYHELGHAYDWTHLTDRNRHRLEQLMGDRGRNWTESADPHGGAADDFADVYAWCAGNFRRPGWRNADFWPTLASPGGIRAACELIAGVRRQVGNPGAFERSAVP